MYINPIRKDLLLVGKEMDKMPNLMFEIATYMQGREDPGLDGLAGALKQQGFLLEEYLIAVKIYLENNNNS